MANSPDRDAERYWLEELLIKRIRAGQDHDWWTLYKKAIPMKAARSAELMTLNALLRELCGHPNDPRCRLREAPARFRVKKSRLRRTMVMAALKRLERDHRIERVVGREIKRHECRPAGFSDTTAYRLLNIMDALAQASRDLG